MRARVYRNIDVPSSLLGLALPYELGFVALIFVLGTAWAPIWPTVFLTVLAYFSLRIAGRKKPTGYLQDLIPFLLRRFRSNGRYSPAARAAPQPRFPFARFEPPLIGGRR